jgi:hypothetical protein
MIPDHFLPALIPFVTPNGWPQQMGNTGDLPFDHFDRF